VSGCQVPRRRWFVSGKIDLNAFFALLEGVRNGAAGQVASTGIYFLTKIEKERYLRINKRGRGKLLSVVSYPPQTEILALPTYVWPPFAMSSL
jgi:hypothetical protein